jgi:hypothetical protein
MPLTSSDMSSQLRPRIGRLSIWRGSMLPVTATVRVLTSGALATTVSVSCSVATLMPIGTATSRPTSSSTASTTTLAKPVSSARSR